MKRIARIVTILGLATVSLGTTGNKVYAISHTSAHPSSHPSAHPSSHPASHPTARPTSRPATTPHTSATPHSNNIHGPSSSMHTPNSTTRTNTNTGNTSSKTSNIGAAKTVSPTTKAINRLPQTPKVSKSIERAKATTTYRSDYLYWHGYYDAYYGRPMFSYYYPWMPWWFWNSHNHESTKVKQEAQKKNMRWIKVDDKAIAVPKKIYAKIKVGDTVELTDNTHININGHTYSR